MTRTTLSFCMLLAACGSSGLKAAPAVAQVSGDICDPATHYFVAQASVVLTEYNDKGVPITAQKTTTDDTGHFKIDGVDPGTQKIHVQKGDFSFDTEVTVTGQTSVTLPAPSGCQLPTGTITGKICDQGNGRWIGGATLTVDGPSGTLTSPVLTDDMGRFTFTDVPAGARTLTATNQGFVLQYTVNVPAGGSVDLGINDCVQSGLSNIDGQICVNAQGIWLSGATVDTQDGATDVTATTDANGEFVLRGLSVGAHHVTVTKGAFGLSFDATTTANTTTHLSAPLCTAPDLPVAAVSGDFDAVQKVLERLQFSNVKIYAGYADHNEVHDLAADFPAPWAPLLDNTPDGSGGVIANSAPIFGYKIVFFNSGVDLTVLGDAPTTAKRLGVLRAYLAQGGFVYASDWAYALLTGLGGDVVFHNAAQPQGADVGIVQNIAAAAIVNPELATVLGSPTMDLDFSLPEWAVVDRAGPSASIYVQTDVRIAPDTAPVTIPGAPVLLSFPVGTGRVVFASFFASSASNDTVDKLMSFLIFEL